MSRKQSKRARFAHRQRVIAAIARASGMRDGAWISLWSRLFVIRRGRVWEVDQPVTVPLVAGADCSVGMRLYGSPDGPDDFTYVARPLTR